MPPSPFGQRTSPTPHVTTTACGGTERTLQRFGIFPPCRLTTLVWSASDLLRSGPATRLCFALKRYQADGEPFAVGVVPAAERTLYRLVSAIGSPVCGSCEGPKTDACKS